MTSLRRHLSSPAGVFVPVPPHPIAKLDPLPAISGGGNFTYLYIQKHVRSIHDATPKAPTTRPTDAALNISVTGIGVPSGSSITTSRNIGARELV